MIKYCVIHDAPLLQIFLFATSNYTKPIALSVFLLRLHLQLSFYFTTPTCYLHALSFTWASWRSVYLFLPTFLYYLTLTLLLLPLLPAHWMHVW